MSGNADSYNFTKKLLTFCLQVQKSKTRQKRMCMKGIPEYSLVILFKYNV